jgi:phytoene dehydrogenase-like protein
MPEPEEHYDALVIGSGAGGMAAAARLAHHGYRTLLVEERDRVGGRASSVDIDGFTVNTGAIVTELGGENGRLFNDLGLDIGARPPRRPLVLRLGHRDLPLMSGPIGLLFRSATSGLGRLARHLTGIRPAPGVTLSDWLDRRRAPDAVHRLARNLTSAMFAAEPGDVDALLFFDYLTKPGGLSTYGVHPTGAIGPWQTLADDFERRGGTLWLNSSVVGLAVNGAGQVDRAAVRRDGTEVSVSTRVVVSNAGPLATMQLCPPHAWPPDYPARVSAWSRPGTLITINFASRRPMSNLDGLVFFGSTDRLSYAANVTAMSPAMAPPGWHLYAATSTPHPATTGFDEQAEVELLRRDLRAGFPEFDQARELSVEVCTGQRWPAQRAIVGHDLPNTTPIPNLWNVGDGARPWATAGQSGCVESARLVTDQIRHQLDPHPTRESGLSAHRVADSSTADKLG